MVGEARAGMAATGRVLSGALGLMATVAAPATYPVRLWHAGRRSSLHGPCRPASIRYL
jgi:hypothetical protein